MGWAELMTSTPVIAGASGLGGYLLTFLTKRGQQKVSLNEAILREQSEFRADMRERIDQLERMLELSEGRCDEKMRAQAAVYEAKLVQADAKINEYRHDTINMRAAMKMVCLIPGMPQEKVDQIISQVETILERSVTDA